MTHTTDAMNPTEDFLPQLRAALDRHDETGGNWATLGAIKTACGAVWGDPDCRRSLSESDAWRLQADGLLPVGPEEGEDG